MRTIKFRFWNATHKMMLYNLDLSDDSTLNEIFEYWSKDGDVAMQFTGLLDKNGKEIYADDIISDGEWKQRVYATEGGFAVKSLFWSGDFRDLKLGDDLILEPLSDPQTISYIKQNCEVIGNIYE